MSGPAFMERPPMFLVWIVLGLASWALFVGLVLLALFLAGTL